MTAPSIDREAGTTTGVKTGTPTNHEHYIPTSHESIRHDSIANLGYDWSRIADPGIAPRPPFKVYLPRTTEDVVRAVIESKDAGEPLVVRGHGHSSNNLVTPEHGVVLLTEHMTRIVDVDEKAMTVTVQAGATLMGVDLYLSEQGLGLSIIGDHDHITAAGFASVGGISPASHRYGMFVDTVTAIEYVDWEGKVHQVGRSIGRSGSAGGDGQQDLMRLLCGTGRHGVITELTIDIVRVDKFRTVYRNNRHLTTDINEFVRYSNRMIREPGDAVMERGVWADFGLPGAKLGQFSSYHTTNQAWYKSLWNDAAYGVQHLIGNVAGRLPTLLDDFTKFVGMACIMLSPQYAGQKNIERFTDQILDSTVGDPTRMFVVLAPVDRYESLFHQLNELAVAERRRSGAITFISIYVKSIKSEYLGGGDPTARHCELMLYLGVRPEKMTTSVLDRLVTRIDQLVAQAGAFRYLHSLTSTDPTLRQKVDPNSRYAGRPTAASAPGADNRDAGNRKNAVKAGAN